MRCHSPTNPPMTCREEAPAPNGSGASEFCGRRRDFLKSERKVHAQSPRTKFAATVSTKADSDGPQLPRYRMPACRGNLTSVRI
jgi:hypothetical protein